MANIDSILIDSIKYDIEDTAARQALNGLAFGINSEGLWGIYRSWN